MSVAALRYLHASVLHRLQALCMLSALQLERWLRRAAIFFQRVAEFVGPRLDGVRADPRVRPVLCFGDSITEGYAGIWPHPTFAPGRQLPSNVNANEHDALRLHPYSIRLGQLLAADVGDGAGGYKDSLRYARVRAYSGWTSAELLPVLRCALREGPWRCAIIMAGVNDVVWEGASAATVLGRLEELYAACDEAGVPVIAMTNLDADVAGMGVGFSHSEAEEKSAAIAQLARGVLNLRRRRAVGDARAALPLSAEHYDDSLHLSPAGSRKLAEVAFGAIKHHRM